MWWRELDPDREDDHADRRLRALGYETARRAPRRTDGSCSSRGVWHLHIVLGMQTAPEREWARAYVETLSESSARREAFGFVDAQPLETAPRGDVAVRGCLEQVPRQVAARTARSRSARR